MPAAALPEMGDGSPPPINSVPTVAFKIPTPEEISKEWRLLDSMVVKEPHDDAFRMLRYPTAMQPSNIGKNRWKDVLPDEVTRVKLECTDEDWCSTDYINANHIRAAESGSGAPLPGAPHYIACQAPTLDTVGDFWRMIWQQHVPVVVMLTRLTEGSKTKATQYWPQWLNQPTSYGRLIVTLLNEEFLSGNCSAIIRSLRIEPSGGLPAGDPPRVVFHLHYEEWPDFGVPESTRLLRDVLAYLDMLQTHWPQATAAALAGVPLKDSLSSSASSISSASLSSPLARSNGSLLLSSSGSATSLTASHTSLTLSSSTTPRSTSGVPIPRKSSGSPGSTAPRKTSTNGSASTAPRKPSSTRVDVLTSPRGTGRSQSGSNLTLSATGPTKRHSMHAGISASTSQQNLARAPPDPSLAVSPHPRGPLARSVPAASQLHATASAPSLSHSKRQSLAQSDPEERRALNSSGVIASPPSSASNSPRTRSRSTSQDIGTAPALPSFGPLVFHCSAGIGRAGTLLSIHISLERMKHSLEVNVAETVHLLRQQRRGMVQNEEQYAFIYRVLSDIVNERQREDRMRRRGADDIRASGLHASGLHASGLHSSAGMLPPTGFL